MRTEDLPWHMCTRRLVTELNVPDRAEKMQAVLNLIGIKTPKVTVESRPHSPQQKCFVPPCKTDLTTKFYPTMHSHSTSATKVEALVLDQSFDVVKPEATKQIFVSRILLFIINVASWKTIC